MNDIEVSAGRCSSTPWCSTTATTAGGHVKPAVNFIHRPFSDVFLVYNGRRDERTGEMLSRAVIAKMTYLVAL